MKYGVFCSITGGMRLYKTLVFLVFFTPNHKNKILYKATILCDLALKIIEKLGEF